MATWTDRRILDLFAIDLPIVQAPLAANAAAPLRAAGEERGSTDWSPLCAGQAAALGREVGAGELTVQLAAEAAERLRALSR